MKLLIALVMLFALPLFAEEKTLQDLKLAPKAEVAKQLPAKKVVKPVAEKKKGAKISIGVSSASAQDVIPAPPVTSTTLAPAPAEDAKPSFLDPILKLIASSAAAVGFLLGLFEMFLRIFPSKKPKSILVPLKYAIDGTVEILYFISNKLLLPMINTANKSEEKLEKSA